jgi:hypothetical protein
VEKSEVKRILAPYSPPLSLNQVEAIADEIVSEATKTAAEAPKPARRKPSRSKSRS